MFPFSIEGSIEVPSVEPGEVEALMGRIEQSLVAVRAMKVTREGTRITFKLGLWPFGKGGIGFVNAGEILIIPGALGSARYKFALHRMLFLALISGSICVGLIGPFQGLWKIDWGTIIWWLALIIFNYVVAAFSVPHFVRIAIGVKK